MIRVHHRSFKTHCRLHTVYMSRGVTLQLSKEPKSGSVEKGNSGRA